MVRRASSASRPLDSEGPITDERRPGVVPRPPRPDDLYRLRIATEPQLSPDGRWVVVSLQTVAPTFDGYRRALWLISTDPSAGATVPRQLTLGIHDDWHPRFSPDGHSLAFLSDRRTSVENEPPRATRREREDTTQVHLLPMDGPGEARRLTDLPRGVTRFEWSPDGSRLVAVSTSHGATRREDARRRGIGREPRLDEPPESDYRYVDRLDYMLNGVGFRYDRIAHLWLVDATTGTARRLTDGRAGDGEPAWSPDGRRIAFVSDRGRAPDLRPRSAIHVVDVDGGQVTAITVGPRSMFFAPEWLPDGTTIAALGHRLEGRAGSRNDVYLLAADGSDATPDGGRNLSARHDLMPGSAVNSDVTRGESAELWPAADGRTIAFSAPIDGAMELWRISTSNGALERLTSGRHYLSAWHAVAGARGRTRFAYLRSTPTTAPDVWVQDGAGEARQVTRFNDDLLAELTLGDPLERHVEVDGRSIQGWYLAPTDGTDGRAPVVTEIHGGPHTLYGWAPMWEFQILAGSGMGVFACNPRGSEGYGQAFNDANHRDWGPGPMRDVLGGIDALVADGLADPARLGVTGGSYGGYLTNWIVGHDDRFAAALTCRSVSDMSMLFLTGDIAGGDWAQLEFDGTPWSDPEYFREISPLTYAHRATTPLLIQHSERDLRTTVGQAEALFTVLRTHHRPVRLLRVPEETHELTRSGTPFRRVENLAIVRDWFHHFLVDGKRRMPPLPRIRGGR
jgi:dipeptidyl aminopeptidase/acylaminoacyl peptidase